MKLRIWHVASSTTTPMLMAKRDSETRIPFGAGAPARVPAMPPGHQHVASDEIRLVMLLA